MAIGVDVGVLVAGEELVGELLGSWLLGRHWLYPVDEVVSLENIAVLQVDCTHSH